MWSIRDISIDSLVLEQNRSQNRFGHVNAYRLFEQGIKTVTLINEQKEMPGCYLLMQNYPNPFNPTTKISFSIPKFTHVTLKVFDVIGREISSLLNKDFNAGKYEVEFNGKELSSGVYFYTLMADDFIETKKLLLMK